MRKSLAPSKNSYDNDKVKMFHVNIKNSKIDISTWSTEEFKNPFKKTDFTDRMQYNICKNEGGEATQKINHEEFIRHVLSKPYICPITNYEGYNTCSKYLGIRKTALNISLHDPYGENALVLYEANTLSETNKILSQSTKKDVHVVVDPILTKFLRPHQRQGVKFMYDCVTGKQIENNFGCIMADEMGLGKTLQCITVLWTLLKQSCQCKPEISKAIIVCPASLVKNWNSEIDKWLSKKLCTICVDSGSKSDIEKDLRLFMQTYGKRCSFPLLIISYETFRLHHKILISGPIGLVICDEGHRLKNKDSLTYKALDSLQTQRRILISGTPIQNDLLEYFSLVHFVNSGILGTSQQFKKYYENPILRGRQVDASDQQRQIASERLNELLSIVNKCIIRRTASILSKYLPTKTEQIVCCNLTEHQRKLYEHTVSYLQNISLDETDSKHKTTNKANGDWNSVLISIDRLKKLCNHPNLVETQSLSSKNTSNIINPNMSGKMLALDCILAIVKSTTKDKVVLVSNYTQTLDMFEELCNSRNYSFVRLDGSMSIKKRHKIVTSFNDPEDGTFIFMLSSKAGGCGLNLIGANRLIMFDPDWNPANDDQAMARVWRDGQKKPVFIYRLITTATIEERILQRQFHKKSLSRAVVDEKTKEDQQKNGHNQTQNDDVELKPDLLPLQSFSREELADLFSMPPSNLNSYVHQSLNCKRCINGIQSYPPKNTESNDDLNNWNHCSSNSLKIISDNVLRSLMASGRVVTFVFYRRSHETISSSNTLSDSITDSTFTHNTSSDDVTPLNN